MLYDNWSQEEYEYVLMKFRLFQHINYIMQKQDLNTSQSGSRHRSQANPISLPISPPPSSFPSNILSVPAQHFPNRPASTHGQRLPLSQSFVSRSNSNVDTQHRELKLDSMARLVHQQQQDPVKETNEINHGPANKDKNIQQFRTFFNQYSGRNNGKFPTSNPSMFCSQETRVIKHEKEEKLSQHNQGFPQAPKQQFTYGDFKIEINSKKVGASRQIKTDRDNSSKFSNLGNSSQTPEARNAVPPNYKVEALQKISNIELDSTVNSSIKGLQQKQSLMSSVSTRESDSLIKRNSPTNFWPLSISPSEQKRQNVLYDQLVKTESEKKGENDQDYSNTEFKKKKNFQFLRNLKKKFSVNSIPNEEKKFQINNFELMDKIGKGAFGDVYIAQEKVTGFMCVIKRLLKKKLVELKMEQQLMREIKIQSYLQHRHLTSIYGFFSDQKYIYLILQLMPDGSLMQVKKKRKIPESQVSFYIRQICLGLKYMHTENVIHRDIKPQNIFLNDTYAKIGDFGCSIYTLTLRNTQIGSFAYISPEQLKMESYNQKIDVWSLGVMTYEMLVGASPFEADIIEIAKQQKPPVLSELKFPSNVELSPEAKDFVIKMLNLDPVERLGIDEAVRHQFIQKYIKKEDEGSASKNQI